MIIWHFNTIKEHQHMNVLITVNETELKITAKRLHCKEWYQYSADIPAVNKSQDVICGLSHSTEQ